MYGHIDMGTGTENRAASAKASVSSGLALGLRLSSIQAQASEPLLQPRGLRFVAAAMQMKAAARRAS